MPGTRLITLPPIHMEPDRGGPFKRKIVFQDPLSGSILIGGRVRGVLTQSQALPASCLHDLGGSTGCAWMRRE